MMPPRPRVLSLLLALFTWAPVQANGERLSRLIEQTERTDYLAGLTWTVATEIPAQAAARQQLLHRLASLPAPHGALAARLGAMPITGRVVVPLADARWLAAHPARDPVLGLGMQVLLPPRPTAVTVFTESGERCAVPHRPGALLQDYLAACAPDPDAAIDWVWVAQPDGKTRRFGIALWNTEPQDEAAPGAWLWAPSRAAGIESALSDEVIAFLATQGPASDPLATPRRLYPSTPASPATPATPARTPPPGGRAAPPFTPQPAHDTPTRTAPLPALSKHDWLTPQALTPTPSDWGSIGLLQTPTARMASVGDARLHVSRVAPYTRMNVFVQPFDWLEAGFRYTSISNRLYGPAELSGDQAYKDKSLDAKIRLLRESATRPEVAVGLRDMTGTGLFSGEYLVGNKRFGPLDVSVGMAWGYGAGQSTLSNPLSALSKRFDSRGPTSPQGGQFSISNYFAGNPALFGGVALQLPEQPLILKLEYDSNDYRNEPQDNDQPQKSRWNLGVVYRLSRHTDLAVGVERGNTLMVALNFHAALNRMTTPKLSDAPLPPLQGPRPAGPADWAAISREIGARNDWQIRRIEQQGRALRLTVDDAGSPYWRERVNTATALIHHHAPEDIDSITFAYTPAGLPAGEHVVDRAAWVAERSQLLPPSAQTSPVVARAPRDTRPDTLLHLAPAKRFNDGLGLALRQSLGGPDGFVLYQLSALHRASFNFTDQTWLQSTLELGLLDNYEKFRYTAPSNLPRVRTFQREYATTSDLRLANLQATHVGHIARDHYYSLYAGYLEAMYAGAGGEWLYRPYASRLALGVDVNAVRAREFDQHFGLRDYRVNTGHATLYWDTGWQDVQVNLSAGQYLAGDRGATLEFSRGFDNGVRMGAYFTKTNVSSAEFGEGSFDKGVFVSIPFDAFLTRSTKNTALFVWRPLIRDGGARLARSVSLYDLTAARDPRALRLAPAKPEAHLAPPAEHGDPRDEHDANERADRDPPPPAITPRPVTRADDTTDPFERRVAGALNFQGYAHVRIELPADGHIRVHLQPNEMRPIGRAAHRAALTILRAAPLDLRSITLVFEDNALPIARYTFFDLAKLDDFYSGLIDEAALAPFVEARIEAPEYAHIDPLHRFADLRRAQDQPGPEDALAPMLGPLRRVKGDFIAAGRLMAEADWARAFATGAGLILSSHLIDRRADDFARDHQDNRALRGARRVGNAYPLIATAGAAAHALLSRDLAAKRTSYAATEAAGTALVLSSAVKTLTRRERPDGSDKRAFPSNHAAVAWAVTTPYALEYRAPWLYAAPLLTQFARVQSREHWVSDTVAGALLGYALGQVFHEAGRRDLNRPRILVGRDEVGVSWAF